MKRRSIIPLHTLRRHISSNVNYVPETISNRDLYLSNDKLMSSQKIPYDGVRPSLYHRSSYDFQSQYKQNMGNNQILDLLEKDLSFGAQIAHRSDSLQKFVGPDFILSQHERVGILCGLNNMEIELKNTEDTEGPFSTITYETEKLRAIGKSIVQLHLCTQTVFANERHLSSSSYEIRNDVDFFQDSDDLVIEFMKKNLLYHHVFPYRGAMKSGPIHSFVEYSKTKKQIREKTSIGSFYTMIGLLCTKFDKQLVIQKLVLAKILNGSLGLINLRIERETRS